MTKLSEILGSQGINISTYQKLGRNKSELLRNALLTPIEKRSPSQERLIFNIAWLSSRNANRVANVEIAHGVSIHTGSGKRTFLRRKRVV